VGREDRRQKEPQMNAEGRRSRQEESFDRINWMNKKIEFDPV
jgi:hypothetical protein